MSDKLPPGTLAYREYEVPAPDGGNARYAFTLGDKAAETIQGQFARQKGAIAYGLVSVVGWPGAPCHPLIWMHDHEAMAFVVADEDSEVPEGVRAIITRYLAVFFQNVADVAPDLAALQLRAKKKATPDRTVN